MYSYAYITYYGGSMRKTGFKILSSLLCAAVMLCGCYETRLPEHSVANGSFGGIAFDAEKSTARSAEPIPQITTASSISAALSDSQTGAAETEQTAETTSASIATTAATATATTTTTAATTAKKTTVTTAATTTKAATSATTTATAAATKETTTTETKSDNRGEYRKNSYKALNYDELKGVWISYLEISTLLKNKSEDDFRSAVRDIYGNCAKLGLNTVFVHARAFGDAFYDSALFPFTKYISGQYGVKVSYDPFEILVDEAHRQGLSIHAWINPLRLCTTADIGSLSGDYPIKKWYGDSAANGTYIVNVNGTLYLNPAYDDAIKLVGDGVREIVSGYDVDGIHIDDYFYPTTEAYFDSKAFSASGSSSLSAFRISNCSKLVKEIYSAVHECSSTAVFGISTQGSMSNNINQLYADAQAWCEGGYVDYFAPQIYYGFENSTQPFKTCTEQWNELVDGTDVKLAIGLAVYKIGAEDKWAGAGAYEWTNTDTMLKRQIEFARSCKNYGGIALYSYNYLFTSGYLTNAIQRETENFKPLLTE